jgi:hypothetical protein
MTLRPRFVSARCLAAALALLILTGLAGCGGSDAAASADPHAELLGHWMVDVDATLEAAKQDPTIPASQIERMPSIVESMMERLTMEITPESIIYHAGPLAQQLDYTIRANADRQVVTEFMVRGELATCTFNLMPGDRMRFKSSSSDDMDVYIWTRSEQSVAVQDQ